MVREEGSNRLFILICTIIIIISSAAENTVQCESTTGTASLLLHGTLDVRKVMGRGGETEHNRLLLCVYGTCTYVPYKNNATYFTGILYVWQNAKQPTLPVMLEPK